ncbi:MAG: J domain-containing protein [Verrucomicrobiae bacterium]|nr:J domain-containing protein [Verrucomicrobiae bacterium]
MEKLRTHYDNLQVVENASIEVIKGAYRYLSQKWHPDKNPNNRIVAERITKIINEAYEVLSDPAQRQQHDNWIREQREQTKQQSQYPPPTPEPFKETSPNIQVNASAEQQQQTENAIHSELEQLDQREASLFELRRMRKRTQFVGYGVMFVISFIAFGSLSLVDIDRGKEVDFVRLISIIFVFSIIFGLFGLAVAGVVRWFMPSQRYLEQEEAELKERRERIERSRMSMFERFRKDVVPIIGGLLIFFYAVGQLLKIFNS